MHKKSPSDIYIYNPTADLAIVNGTISYMPPLSLRIFEEDLAFLPSIIAKENDIVISQSLPSNRFTDTLGNLAPKLNYCNISQIISDHPNSMGWLRPWSWSPSVHHKLKPLKEFCCDEFKRSPNSEWETSHKNLFSRNTSVRLIRELKKVTVDNDKVRIPAVPEEILSKEGLNDIISRYNHRLVIKAPWSSSGRGILIISDETSDRINYNWLWGTLKQQGFLTAEPFLKKVTDISFHFRVDATGTISYLGHTFFKTDNKGRFLGCSIEAFPHDTPIDFIDKSFISDVIEPIQCSLKKLNLHQLYVGPIGIDALFFLDEKKQVKLNPCIEVNLRYTMGYYNLKLREKLHPDAKGYWQIQQFKPGEWLKFLDHMRENHPIIKSEDKMIQGHIPLTDQPKSFGAWIELL